MWRKWITGSSGLRRILSLAGIGAGLAALLTRCDLSSITGQALPFDINQFGAQIVLPEATLIGWVLLGLLALGVAIRVCGEMISIAMWRLRGIPIISLGDFHDATGQLPGLGHQVAFHLDNAGLATYDEKGAVPPEFNLLIGTPSTEAELISRLLRVILTPRMRRLACEISMVDGQITGAARLTDTGTGFIRYLRPVTMDPKAHPALSEQVTWLAQRLAIVVLADLTQDPNTRGLLLQHLGDYGDALQAFQEAVHRKRSPHLRATMNLGNLYSLMHLHARAVQILTSATERATEPQEIALLQASLACAYRSWEQDSPAAEKGAYDWLARQSLEHALACKADTPLLHYTIGCYWALGGQDKEALQRLREAVAGNVQLLDYALDDPDLAGLRERLGDRSLAEELGMVPPGSHRPRPTLPPNPTAPTVGQTTSAVQPAPVQSGMPLATAPPVAAPPAPWPGTAPSSATSPERGWAPLPETALGPITLPGQPGAPPLETLRPPAGRGNPT